MNALTAVVMLLLSPRMLTQPAVAPQTPLPQPPSEQGAVQAPGVEQPTFRAGVDVVSLNVTVTDRDGRFLTSLAQEAFSVFEDGAKQDVTFFSGAQLPTALALVVDTSASMSDTLGIAQQAGIGFVERMRPEDVLTVIDFDSRAEVLQPFTADQGRLTAALRRTSAGGSTSLYNALYIALHEFRKIRAARTEQDVRRQAIVVLSDGEDTSSLVSFQSVLELARRTEVAIYTISLRDGSDRTGVPAGSRESDVVMKQLAHETGGNAFFPSQASELPAIYARVADELAAQYTVGYASRNSRRDGRWRRVVVRVERPNVTARTKQGYYGPTE